MSQITTDAHDLPDLKEEKPFSFSMGNKEEEVKKSSFVAFAQDLYIAEVSNISMVKQKAYMSEELVDSIQLTLNLLRTVEGGTVMNINGEPAEKTFMRVWLNPEAKSYNKKTGEAHLTRKAFTAIMGLPVEAAIDNITDSDILGRKVKVYVETVTKGDITRNKINQFTPIKPA